MPLLLHRCSNETVSIWIPFLHSRWIGILSGTYPSIQSLSVLESMTLEYHDSFSKSAVSTYLLTTDYTYRMIIQ